MGKAHQTILFLVTVAAVLAFGHTGIPEETGPFERVRAIVRGDGSSGPYDTGQRFIGGTAAVDSSESDLHIAESNGNEGTVTFDSPLADGDSAGVTFAVPPEWLRESYERQDDGSDFGLRTPTTYTSGREKTPKPFPGLSFGGSKTFDINVGSDKQAALNQTLRLNISGKLTDDISLNAVISDQNVPITPEGDTQELNELDRVLIELRGKHFRVDMGDTDLVSDTGRWLSYTRRLSGAMGTVSYGGAQVFASGAVSEGRHMSTTIAPIEGNQGPYRLSAENGSRDISIVAGTEKVWINGERLTRGINDDYTIDYSTGELTFTENRIIGSDMRIVCDYEYTSESFRRTFYSAGANLSLGGDRLRIGLIAAKEEDDPDRPVLTELSEGMRDMLAASGDSTASYTGIRIATDDTTGTYDMVEGHLVYNPLKNGEYNVTFSWVGDDEGSYRYAGGGVYEFVEETDRLPGSGASYDPVVILQGPVSHTVAGMHAEFDPLPSVHIESEAAGSLVDENTLSSLHDGNNDGGAYTVGIALTPSLPGCLPLGLSLMGDYRTQGEKFRTLDRDRSAEDNRRWGFPLVMNRAKEQVTEYSGGITVQSGAFTGSGFDISGGRFELGEEALSTRAGASGRLRVAGRGGGVITYEHIIRELVPSLPDETIDRIEGDASWNAAGFVPSLDWEAERSEGRGDYTHGASYGELTTGIETPPLLGMKAGTEWLYRIERAKRNAWTDSSSVRGISVDLASAGSGAGTLKTRYSRRERFGGGEQSVTDQALLEGSWRPDNGAVSLDLSYRAGRSRETTKRRNYIYVGSGQGSYRWEDTNDDGVRDDDEFIPDSFGSYYLYEETLDDYRPVNVVSVFGSFGLKLPRGLIERLSGRPLDITTATSFEVNESSAAQPSDVFLLRLSRFRKRGITTTGDARFQEDITVPVADGGSLRLRFFRYASYNGEYVTGDERRNEGEESVRLRLPVRENWDTEIEVSHSGKTREMETGSSGDFDVASYGIDSETSYYPRSSVKSGLKLGGGIDSDDVTGIETRHVTISPVFTYYFGGRGRVETSYAITSVTATGLDTGETIPYTMAKGRKDGTNHDISVTCDYRLSHRMNIVASYNGRRFAGEDFEHFARTQLRAMF